MTPELADIDVVIDSVVAIGVISKSCPTN